MTLINQDNLQDYKVLARKYRPMLFKEILGQDYNIRIIRAALKTKKIPHAFLLTGIRGIGKTTLARLIAQAINCLKLKFDENKEPEPCLNCAHCISLLNNTQQDVIEIDAASNTSINDIKEIIKNFKYKPVSSHYKIFILDEVHMLSNSAFNALLKPLEEPPTHIKIILATTEIKKVPLTIISRCQRLDLHRLNLKHLVHQILYICDLEQVKIEKEATYLLAQAAQGSARDALSMLDQALLHTQDFHIRKRDVENMLGIVNANIIYQLFSCLIDGDVKNMLSRVRTLHQQGADLSSVITNLANITYQISILKLNDHREYIYSDVEQLFCKKYTHLSIIVMIRLWQMLQKAHIELKNTNNELISIEMSMIKIMHSNLEISPEEALISIKQYTQKNKKIQTKKKKFNTI